MENKGIHDSEEIIISEQLDTKIVSITEAARLNNVTRQAIYVAIKLNKLKAKKESSRWTIHLDDLQDYRQKKYSRSRSVFAGELIFDQNKGYYSVNQVAKLLKVPAQKIYYATRSGQLKAHRKGAAWVIHIDDIRQYEKQLNEHKSHKQVI
ncbi:MAG: lysine-rich histone-specific protease [Chlamydiales bacterium]|jgi:excisionase family DNA binding protein|nr:lysine-rich histone-specific protease [Chlamydiales bacterium]